MKIDSSDRKISSFDKFQALRRNPSYRADYWDFTFWCREKGIDEADYIGHPVAAKKAEEVCNKYSITYLFNPSTDIPKHWGDTFFNNEEEIVEVLYPTDYRDLSDDEKKKGIRPPYLPIPLFNNGENLILKINLKADLGDIAKEIFDQLKYYKAFIQINNSRMTQDRKVDKWKVWDAYNQTKSFKKAVEKINEKHASLYKKIIKNFGLTPEAPQKLDVNTARKAYYRAFELVHGEKFNPEEHRPAKLPVKLRKTCDKCPEYSTCKALCPEVLEFVSQDAKYQRETPKPEQELDLLSSPRSHRKAPKPTME